MTAKMQTLDVESQRHRILVADDATARARVKSQCLQPYTRRGGKSGQRFGDYLELRLMHPNAINRN